MSCINFLKKFNFYNVNFLKNKMSATILIIGGTSLIRKTINKMLSKRNPQLKILIGTLQKDMIPNQIQIDVNSLESFDPVKKHAINVIILCTKDANNHVLNYAVKHKIDYFDITRPSNELLQAHDSIKNNFIESKIVFSSGWMEGITPSFLYTTSILANEIQSIKMMVYYLTKFKVSSSSADFLAHNVNKLFLLYHKRKVSDFDIANLYIFNQIAQIPTVRAKMTFDSKVVSAILPIMQKIGFFKA